MSDVAGTAHAPDRSVERLFDALSATYDAVGVDFFGPIAASLCASLAPERGDAWLDIGCGRGAVAAQVFDTIGESGRVVGLDISTGMVEQARHWAASSGVTNTDFQVGDAMDPPPDLGRFDVIASSLVLFFLPDPAAAVRRWREFLVPGGRLGITTFGPADDRWQHVDEVFVSHLPPTLNDARTSGTRGPFASDEGMVGLVRDAGYVDARTVAGSIDVRFASAQQWYDFTWSIGQRAMWLAIPEASRGEVRAEAERRLAEHAAGDGSITFRQAIRHTLARRL